LKKIEQFTAKYGYFLFNKDIFSLLSVYRLSIHV